MNILCVGDVCGSVGCRALMKLLPQIKRENCIDFTVVNGENSADGNGITSFSIDSVFAAGADVVTGGNHSFRREESFSLLDESPFLLRPHNVIDPPAGKGYCLVDCGRYSVAVINLSGVIGLEKPASSSPFEALDELVERAKNDGAKIILVDFHAEATSEKRALGLYSDSKVSAFFGTHTHVLTADAQVLPYGTGYITDLGMTGPINSVLGVRSDIIIERLKSKNMQKFVLADGPCFINGCIFEVDEKSGLCLSAKQITVYEEAGR